MKRLGTLVIPKGGLAFATVTEAQSKRRMARGGKLDVNIDYVKLLDSEPVSFLVLPGISSVGKNCLVKNPNMKSPTHRIMA